jgi:hypothetical protein
MSENFNELESAIFAWLKSHYSNGHLSAQIDSARFSYREWTKAGFYVYFDVPAEIGALNLEDFQGHWPISGPNIQSPSVQYNGGSILWGKDGFINCLELYAFGDQFDEHVTEFTLS